MKLIRGLYNLASQHADLAKGCVLTIGNFDGVHLGHQQILKNLRKEADSQNLPSVVMLFEPLPVEFFNADKAPVRLMNFREKMNCLQQSGLVDVVLLCRFNHYFANQMPLDFIEGLLVGQLKVKKLIVGDDFKFGQHRAGNFQLLKQEGAKLGMIVEQHPTFEVAGERVSSTRVRQTLAQADLKQAAYLLGRPFAFQGRVMHGQKLGRQLGFRTLNLNPKRQKMPLSGVFSVTVTGLAEQPVAGVANIGIRPTINGLRPSIEVHLFDWQADVYGEHVCVTLHQFIRAEQKFNGLNELKIQITQDVEQAKQQLHYS